MDKERLNELRELAKDIRRESLQMIYSARSGHPGGSLSIVEILIALYYEVMNIKPDEPKWPGRDRFILSKGHACAALYSILAKKGYFPTEELSKFRKFGGILQGHPDSRKIPGIEISTGSLGQGISVAVGMAIAAKLRNQKHRVFALLGDGECDEGQVWEAALSAAHRKLDNLTVIIDRNGVQLDGTTKEILDLEPLVDKWAAFGFSVKEVDGHDISAMAETLIEKNITCKPKVIIAHTIKGKGISYMEGKAEWHGRCPSEEQYKSALEEINMS